MDRIFTSVFRVYAEGLEKACILYCARIYSIVFSVHLWREKSVCRRSDGSEGRRISRMAVLVGMLMLSQSFLVEKGVAAKESGRKFVAKITVVR